MASTPPQDFPSLDKTLGVAFISVIFAAGLCGITTAQAYWYYTTFPKDPTGLKLLVGITWTLDTVHQALVSVFIYHYVITNYFNPPALNVMHPTAWIPILVEIMVTCLVQSFFLKRIWQLSNRRLVLLVIPALFIVGRLVFGLVWVAQAVPQTKLADLNSQGCRLSEWIHGMAMGGDILLASILVHLLHSSRTGIRQTDNMINRLMLYTVNTSAVTGLFSIGTLVCLLAFPGTFIFGAFYTCVCRLYVNTMLASLNARKNIRNQTTVMEVSLTGDLGGHSHGSTRHSRIEASKQSIPGGAFEGSIKMGNASEKSGKMGVYVNTTRSTCQDAVYISRIEHDSEPGDATV